MLSFDFGQEISRTRYSRSFQVTIGHSQPEPYILEKIDTAKVGDLSQFVECVIHLLQLSHPHILKYHTLFEEEEFLFIVKDPCEFEVGRRRDKFKGLTPTAIGDIFAQVLSAQTYFNNQGIPGITLSLKPKHLYWSEGGLKISHLVPLNTMYMKPRLGYFSVPETESTKEKIEVWNIGVFMLDLCMDLTFLGVSRELGCDSIFELLPPRGPASDPEIHQLLTKTLTEFHSRTTLDVLRLSKFYVTDSPLPQVHVSNSFSIEPKADYLTDIPKVSQISFDVSSKYTGMNTANHLMSIQPKKSERSKKEISLRLADIERRLQSLSDFRRRTEERPDFGTQESKSQSKDRETIELILEQAGRNVS